MAESEAAADSANAERKRSEVNLIPVAQLLESLLVTVLLALFVTTFVVQAYKIPSDSMEPTLLVGDHVLVNKFVFEGDGAWYDKLLPYRSIRRGDMIIFKYAYEDHPDYVKRVIGLPGDHLHILNGHVYVDGKPLDEPYAVHGEPDDPSSQEYFPPLDPYSARTQLLPEWAHDVSNYVQDDELVVPPGRYFVMGDNRDDSLDSRYWGFVDRSAVMGKPILIYWSVDATSDDYADRSVLGTIEAIGDTLVHLPSRTRWHRLLREVH
ncbi:MAG TPA: signal peptidase I [Candidatus Aquilonibacter sp.]|nr:signal peptidase I [Candidatus Aquilonibacter sp.]